LPRPRTPPAPDRSEPQRAAPRSAEPPSPTPPPAARTWSSGAPSLRGTTASTTSAPGTATSSHSTTTARSSTAPTDHTTPPGRHTAPHTPTNQTNNDYGGTECQESAPSNPSSGAARE